MNKKNIAFLAIISLIAINFFALSYWASKVTVASSAKPHMFYAEPRLDNQIDVISDLIYDDYYGSKDKVVFLTFDDGPSDKWTPSILNTLKENNVKATFFVVGTAVQKYPQIFKREIKDGHAIGNHTFSHDFHKIYVSPQNYINDIIKNDLLLKSLGVNTTITRAPAGQKLPPQVEVWLRKNNLRNVMWDMTVDGFTVPREANYLVNHTIINFEHLKHKNHIVVLLHDSIAGPKADSKRYAQISITRNATIQALPEVIKFFKDQGYTFEVIK